MQVITRNKVENPVLVDKYMMGREIEVDAICDGDDILIPGIMEHFERAGVHSGDSISIYPSINIEQKHKDTLVKYTELWQRTSLFSVWSTSSSFCTTIRSTLSR